MQPQSLGSRVSEQEELLLLPMQGSRTSCLRGMRGGDLKMQRMIMLMTVQTAGWRFPTI